MTHVSKTKALQICAAVVFALASTGCEMSPSATSVVKFESPTAPTSTSNKATLFGLSADRLEFTLGNGCEADVNIYAEIQPAGAEQRAIFERPSNTEERDFVVTGPLTARIHIRGPGTYRVWAQPADNASLRKPLDIVAKGTCVGPTVPTQPEPVVDLKANGSDGPLSVAPNSDVRIDWFLERCTSANWIAGPLTGMVGGNGSQTVRITQNTRFGMSCTGPGGSDTDYVDVNVTSAPPPPPTQLTVSPGSLTLYPTSCPSAGTTSGTLTANMAVTWSSNNTHVASVGSNGVVTGLNAGSATITARAADGQQAYVTVTVNSCPQTPPQAPECSISVNPTSILSGQSATLVWSSSGGTTSVVSSWNGSVSLSGSMSVNPTSTTTYSINCSNSAGVTVTRSATLTVTTTSDVCAGANASLPDITNKGQVRGFQINAPSNCKWALRSNNHHVVSVNPAEGTGPSSGSLTALNAGGPVTITFVVNPGPSERVVSTRTYTIAQ